ncbi:MAG: Coenzyme F420 hydrogenase/dehydrogenase, beta subunit C-terminal domain [Candidatus Helarchaeota archaeon]
MCPRTPTLTEFIEKKFAFVPPLGYYKTLTWAQTTDPEISKICQDGGVVTSLLKYFLDNKIIDGAIVNVALSNWESFPTIVRTSKELIKTAGTRYSISPNLNVFQESKIYSSDSNNFQDVNLERILSLLELEDFDYARFAFVGTPCHITAIRKMQFLNIKPANTIKYIIGLFCMENFTYTDLMKEKIEKEKNIKLEDIKKLNIKKDFIITLNDNSEIRIPFKELDEVVRSNCKYCPDFSNIYADISVGGIGAPQNHSVVMIRTDIGAELFDRAVYDKYIREHEGNITQLRERSLKLINRMTKIKKDRALKNLQTIQVSKK